MIKWISSKLHGTLRDLVELLMLACAFCQVALIVYFNFFEGPIHLGNDVSWDFLKTMIVAKEGRYPVELLSDTTAPLIDRLFIIALPIYKICGNIFISYAISNIIVTALCLWLILEIMQQYGFGSFEKLIVINLFICPYMLNGYDWYNDLGYYSLMFVMGGMYSFRVLQMLILYRLILSERLKKKEIVLIVLSALLALIAGVGSGMSMWIMLYIPLIMSRLVLVFIKNDFKVIKAWQSLVIFANALLVIIGRFLGGVWGLVYKDNTERWVNLDELWQNIGKQINGYLKSYSCLPMPGAEKAAMSAEGILYLFAIILFTIAVISFIRVSFKTISNIVKDNNVDVFFITLITVIITTILEFSLSSTTYGDAVFEQRYLLLVVISGFFFVAKFVQGLDEKLLFKQVGIIILFLSIVVMDLVGDYRYKRDTNEDHCMFEMLEVINHTDAGLVYAWGANSNVYEKSLRVFDFDRVYKQFYDDGTLNMWGESMYYNDTAQYKGPTVLFRGTDDTSLPESILKQYEYITTIHNVEFYYCKTNPIDSKALANQGVK